MSCFTIGDICRLVQQVHVCHYHTVLSLVFMSCVSYLCLVFGSCDCTVVSQGGVFGFFWKLIFGVQHDV